MNKNNLVRELQAEKLNLKIYEDETSAGAASAILVAEKLKEAIAEKGKANLILATGASQFAFIEAIKKLDVDWSKITVFHLDEYKGLPETHLASFRKYLKERILNEVKPGKVYLINGDAANIDEEISNYESLLKQHPIDIACIGIGENGHIAFNDPGVADFNDPKLVKVVQLDNVCRNQQLGEGWFKSLADVPQEAISLTIPAIMDCKVISCLCPNERKAQAVYDTVNAPISTDCPATILRTHPNTVVFLDKDSASKLTNN